VASAVFFAAHRLSRFAAITAPFFAQPCASANRTRHPIVLQASAGHLFVVAHNYHAQSLIKSMAKIFVRASFSTPLNKVAGG
jgi:hypothetical protein